MQTQPLIKTLKDNVRQEAEQILRACVHCGFCTATCPTYQLLGDELDGPRGRIYQIKQVLEGHVSTPTTRLHLDRCLTCRSCETTCPSGVRYNRLLEIGREVVEQQNPRPVMHRLKRRLLLSLLPKPALLKPFYQLGQTFSFMLPASLSRQLNLASDPQEWAVESPQQAKKILVLDGCVQSVMTPDTNAIASRVLARLGYDLIRDSKAGCCGAVNAHLNDKSTARRYMRKNIDAWWPHVESGIEAILSTASGCGLMLHEYRDYLADDVQYAEKARMISSLVRDPVELVMAADLSAIKLNTNVGRVAFHAPCTLQHGLKQPGSVENLLQQLGFDVVEIPDSHLCCGSAGTYSIFQPELSGELKKKKMTAIESQKADVIVTANIGCQLHLQSATEQPVRHWLSLLL